MKRLIKQVVRNNDFLSLLGNGSAAALGFISFAILARSLGKDDFGSWVLFITLLTFFDLLRTGLLHTPLIKFSAGKTEQEQREVFGTGWAIAILISGAMSFISLIGLLLPPGAIPNKGFGMFISWVWIFSLSTLPFNFSTWLLQAKGRFDKILFIRLMLMGIFILLLIVNIFWQKGISFVLYSFLFANMFASLSCLLLGWTDIQSIKFFSRQMFRKLFVFGKFSMGTMVGANLLRSSDTLLIGAFLGSKAVAVYSVPLKLFEIIEIPLRSFIATSLPRMSHFMNSNDTGGLASFFERTSGMTTILLLPFTVISFVFAEPMVVLLGGSEYAEAANILRVFAVYAGFMAIDRYTGVTLDVMNQPVRNFQKIIMMLLVNITGDLLVIHFIGQVWAVAAVSIFTFMTGVVFGIHFLRRKLDFSLKRLFVSGWEHGKRLAVKGISGN